MNLAKNGSTLSRTGMCRMDILQACKPENWVWGGIAMDEMSPAEREDAEFWRLTTLRLLQACISQAPHLHLGRNSARSCRVGHGQITTPNYHLTWVDETNVRIDKYHD
jgi:hypothetical protein